MRGNKESGQAIVLVVVALGVLLMGALGLAIDGGQLFAHRQMAQAAADAAAQAAALSILDMTATAANGNDFTGGAFSCTAGSTFTPCVYAAKNGFTAPADQIDVSFPTSVPGVSGLSPDVTPSAVQVVITRPVRTSLMGLFGTASSDIKALAVAALLQITSPVPIVVTHPTLAPSLTLGGNTSIRICGGPQRSIQVNSDGTVDARRGSPISPPQNAVGPMSSGVGNTAFDLSKGGPLDTNRDCTTPGAGTDIAIAGPPSQANSVFSIVPGPVASCANGSICLGTGGHYLEPASPIYDPLAHVNPPTNPGGPLQSPTLPNTTFGTSANQGDCPASAGVHGCKIFFPGEYPTGIQITNFTAIFNPGIYYITGAPTSGSFKDVGFGSGANGDAIMCKNYCAAPRPAGCCDVDKGMLVYLTNTGGVIDLGSNSSSTLVGADLTSSFLGTLFFVARDAPAQTHTIGGGGELRLVGTIYATNCTPGYTCISGVDMTSTRFQTINLQGGSGSGTTLRGEIITSVLSLGGGGSISMQLDPNLILPITQVSLVK